MINAIIDDIKEYFTSLFKKEGRFLLINVVLSIIITVLELIIFSLIIPEFSLIIFFIYSIAIYYGYKFLTKFIQKILIKTKAIKYLPDDYTFNGFDGMYDERVMNNIEYKSAIDHYDATRAYIIIFAIGFFIYMFLKTTYGIGARLVFCAIDALIMFFLTIEPIEYIEGTNHKQPSLIDKVKDGLGLGTNKKNEDLSSITNVIDTFKQSELNQQAQAVQQATQPAAQPAQTAQPVVQQATPVQQVVPAQTEVLEEPIKTEDYYQQNNQ